MPCFFHEELIFGVTLNAFEHRAAEREAPIDGFLGGVVDFYFSPLNDFLTNFFREKRKKHVV